MRAAAVLCILLAASLLAGCSEPAKNAYEPIPPAPLPTVGETFSYRGDDGSQLWGGLTGTGIRMDAYGRDTPVWLIVYHYQTKNGPPMTFEEAIDSSGTLVQQVALCGDPVHLMATCDSNRTTVYLAGLGLPGAFGGGPEWMGQSAFSIAPLDDPFVANFERFEDGCAVWEGDAPNTLRVLPWTFLSGKRKLCEPYPEEFRTTKVPGFWGPSHSVRYKLTNYTAGANTPELPQPRDAALNPVPQTDPGTPFGANLTLPALGFPLEDAHALAMEDPEYARLYAKGGWRHFQHRVTTAPTGPAGQTQWTVHLIAADESGRLVKVQRTHTVAGGQDLGTQDEIVGAENILLAKPIWTMVADPTEAVARSDAWTGLDPARQGLSVTFDRATALAGWLGAVVPSPGAPLIVIGYHDPQYGPAHRPYQTVFDGGGALLHVDLPVAALPFDQRYAT